MLSILQMLRQEKKLLVACVMSKGEMLSILQMLRQEKKLFAMCVMLKGKCCPF